MPTAGVGDDGQKHRVAQVGPQERRSRRQVEVALFASIVSNGAVALVPDRSALKNSVSTAWLPFRSSDAEGHRPPRLPCRSNSRRRRDRVGPGGGVIHRKAAFRIMWHSLVRRRPRAFQCVVERVVLRIPRPFSSRETRHGVVGRDLGRVPGTGSGRAFLGYSGLRVQRMRTGVQQAPACPSRNAASHASRPVGEWSGDEGRHGAVDRPSSTRENQFTLAARVALAESVFAEFDQEAVPPVAGESRCGPAGRTTLAPLWRRTDFGIAGAAGEASCQPRLSSAMMEQKIRPMSE